MSLEAIERAKFICSKQADSFPFIFLNKIYLATGFYAAVASLQAVWDNSMQLTRFASQTRYKNTL